MADAMDVALALFVAASNVLAVQMVPWRILGRAFDL